MLLVNLANNGTDFLFIYVQNGREGNKHQIS